MKILLHISRIFVGVLFIFSGLIKANDPIGFSYKLEEYFFIFNLDFLASIALIQAEFICLLEILLGIFLLIGYKINKTAWILLLLIIFFTFLTGFSAITGKVTDCGCFGDAIPLTPTQSFLKDLILLGFIIIIFKYRNEIKPLINKEKTNFYIAASSSFLIVFFMIYVTNHLPVKDFRPYKIGNNIREGMIIPEGAPEDSVVFTYICKNKTTGETKSFINQYPADYDNWEFIEREDDIVKKGFEPPIHDFKLTDEDGKDYTEDVINNPNFSFLVISYDIKHFKPSNIGALKELFVACDSNQLKIYGLTSSPYIEIDNFRHEHGIGLPFYYADATALKTIIRANPGILLLKDGTILDKWHGNDIPTWKEIEADYLNRKE